MKTMTPKEIAAEFGTDAKTLRKFLRKDVKDRGLENPGKGARWSIPASKSQLNALRKRFDAWTESRIKVEENATEDEVTTDEVTDEVEVNEDTDTE